MSSRKGASKRGRKPKFFDCTWSSDFAYAIGLIVTDGNLSPDLRHIGLTSKDSEQIETFKLALKLKNAIGKKARHKSKDKKYYVIQFGSVVFYSFLLSIGLTPNKSKIIGKIKVPDRFFFDFLRGCIDGDGNINEFHHPESKNPQLRTVLWSASPPFLAWILATVHRLTPCKGGWVSHVSYKSAYSLSFGKQDSIRLFKLLYKDRGAFFLKRKYTTARKYLGGWRNW